MKRLVFLLIFSCLPLNLFSQEVVERIEIVGNERVTRETIMYYLSSREGEYYNEDLLRRDFRVLWSTGFFSNIKIEDEDGTSGKIIKITIEENPIIKEVLYKTGKKVKEGDIVDKLKEKDEYILPYSYYSPYKVQRITATINDLLVEKGLMDGKVEVETNKMGTNEIEVVFRINEGPKLRVGEVVFEGKTKLRDSTLRAAVKENKEHSVLSWVIGKDSFRPNKLDEDIANIKRKLQENGYMEATIGEPLIEDMTKRTIFFKKQTMKRIIIPIDAGYRYFVGEVNVEGNQIISTKYLRGLINLKDGDVYSTKYREKAVEDIQEIYSNGGYLYAQIMPVESLDPKRKRVNVMFHINEGEVAFLHRLNIKGNTYTKEKVIRRELLVTEGHVFSLALFKDSILRMRQLGLVELDGEPNIRPNPEDPAQIDVTLRVKELQRNNVQFTAGYSGYEGTFVALSYSTVNFLGAGETLELMAQYGKRIRNYMFGFSEPYVFDLPITVGFNIYNRYMRYPQMFDQKTKGIDLQFSARIIGYWRTGLVYSYQNLKLDEPTLEDDYYYYNPYYTPYYSGAWGFQKYNISSITPTIYKSTVDSPLTPSRGTLYLASCKLAGGPLGGDVDLIKPRFEFTFYQPTLGEQRFGIHLEYSFLKVYGVTEVPYWERFYLGGERSIRGYDIYQIGPRDETGRNRGGEKSLVFNAEYIIPIGGPIYAIFFHDMGNAYSRYENISLRNMYSSTGLEMRIFVPALRVPFRLIFSYNNRKIYLDDSNFAFRFAIGTTF
ncbi:MAG: outer membrane protein assembly factor BamA [Candidatus Aminicenantes bacterium]|nr:outer membrane protein assembly factor BamA [Candidatus Aminicenantes bacterium]MDH5742019.1 outer membrane protein assembly factor BamA [Candidatus Aminicenantes bacterium]